jgi:hypothetical protein
MKTTTSKANGKLAQRKAESLTNLKKTEVWYQDPEDGNLWHGTHGVIVNTAALTEREFFYNIQRVHTQVIPKRRDRSIVAYA